MTAYREIEICRDFTESSDLARRLAEHFTVAIEIRRHAQGWALLAPAHLADDVAQHVQAIYDWINEQADETSACYAEMREDEIRAEYESELEREILGEMFGYQDDSARADEGGWYYEE